MPLRGVGFLWERREHGTQNQGHKLFNAAWKDYQEQSNWQGAVGLLAISQRDKLANVLSGVYLTRAANTLVVRRVHFFPMRDPAR